MAESKEAGKDIRLSVFTNALPLRSAVVMIKSSDTLEKFLEDVGPCFDDGPFVKAFLSSGAQLRSLDMARDDDVVYVALDGEEFVPRALGGGSAGLLQSIASQAVMQAQGMYTTYVPKVKEALPIVAKPIEKVEEMLLPIQPRVLGYASDFGVPALQWADQQLQMVYTRLQANSEKFLQSDIGQKAQVILIEKTYRGGEAFFNTAVANWKALDVDGKGSVTMSDFVNGMKTKIGSAWHDNLLVPAEDFYKAMRDEIAVLMEKEEGATQLEALIANVRKRLGPKWEKAVTETQQLVPSRIKDPAAAFYQAAVESFVALQMSAHQGQVSANEFIAGIRVKLGGLWDHTLTPVSQQLYDFLNIAQKTAEDEAEAGRLHTEVADGKD